MSTARAIKPRCDYRDPSDNGARCPYQAEAFAVKAAFCSSHTSRADRQEGVELSVGDRVCGGEPGTEDYDEGEVATLSDGQVYVQWQSGVATTQPADLLTRMP